MCVPLTVLAESYAQMFVIFDKFYWSLIKYQLRRASKYLRVKRTASVLRGLKLTNHCMAQLESIMRSWFIIPAMSDRMLQHRIKKFRQRIIVLNLATALQYH